MFRDGALEVHLALLQPQSWKRHSKRRKELYVSVATDIACGSIFHIKTYPPRSASLDQGHAHIVSRRWGSQSRGPSAIPLIPVYPVATVLRTLWMYLAGTSCYAPDEIFVTPRCKAHDPQHI